MPKKTIIRQFALPFDADIVAEIWELFAPEVKKWHKFQKLNSSAGNDFFWWQSRFSEFIQEHRENWSINEYLERSKLFSRIWVNYGEIMRGSPILGVSAEFYEI
jgi:hypothetical protein